MKRGGGGYRLKWSANNEFGKMGFATDPGNNGFHEW
jgi:hypothetical protein